ncbi:restriction endonuclease subunit S [Winogradskyella ouciana]|uniref:restriction endonuclease subunit S n=1 Tax=Winogradskyella ouciana TaxID=2608631 RepID=UPI003D2CA75D
MELTAAKNKQSEVGFIPEGWEISIIEEICDVIDPHPSHRAPKRTRTGVPFLGIGDFDELGNIVATNPRIVGFDVLEDHNKRYNLNENLIGLGRVASIGKVVSLRNDIGDYTISPTLGILRSKSVNPDYLKHILKSDFIQNYFNKIMSGSTRSSVGMVVLRKVPIPIPKESEQQAIAQVLSDTDALIQALQKKITKKKLIRKGTMQRLLKPKENWDIKLIENICDVIDPHPSHRAPAKTAVGIPFLGIGDFDENGKIITENPRIVDYQVLKEHNKRYNLNEGLIGLGRVASIGKVVKLRNDIGDYTISPTLGILRCKYVNADYLRYVLKSDYIKQYFSKVMSGSTRSSVGMIVLRKVPIPLPDENEQKLIVRQLLDIDAEIGNLEQKLSKYKLVKQGTAQQLLTGKIRIL